jgi:hypothetical protein
VCGSSNKGCGSAVITIGKERGVCFVRRRKAAQLRKCCGKCFRSLGFAARRVHADAPGDDIGKRLGESLWQSLKI